MSDGRDLYNDQTIAMLNCGKKQNQTKNLKQYSLGKQAILREC